MPDCCGSKTAVPCARRSASKKRRILFKGQHHCQTRRQRCVEVSQYYIIYVMISVCVYTRFMLYFFILNAFWTVLQTLECLFIRVANQ